VESLALGNTISYWYYFCLLKMQIDTDTGICVATAAFGCHIVLIFNLQLSVVTLN